MSERLHLGSVDDLAGLDRMLVEHDGVEVGVFEVDGEFRAYVNRCPHAGGPVCEGRRRDRLIASQPGHGERLDRAYEGPPAVTCPWHGWTFDIRSGNHIGDDGISLVRVEVRVEDGEVYLIP